MVRCDLSVLIENPCDLSVLIIEFWPTDKSVADEPLCVTSGSTSRSPLEAGRVSMALESESPTDAWAGLW